MIMFLRGDRDQKTAEQRDKYNVPQKVNKTRPCTLITDALRKSRTRNKSPLGKTARVRLDNNTPWHGRAFVSVIGLSI